MLEKSFNRRNLPHLYYNEGIYFITYRLANSLPSNKVAEIQTAIKNNEVKDDISFKRLFANTINYSTIAPGMKNI